MRSRWIVIFLISLTSFCLLQSALIVSAEIPEYIEDGPFIDRIVYRILPNQDQRIEALQSAEIDVDSVYLDTYNLDPALLEVLDKDPNIDIARTLRNGYGHISFHCDMFPVNISGVRRAFAFAFNKTKVTTDIMNGFSQTHDSLVPYLNPFCIEDDLDWHYYDSRPDLGNSILDDLGFAIDSTTGMRKAPNGDTFSVMILHAETYPCRQIAELAVEAFELLHISADYSAPCNCDLHEQMVVFGQNFRDFDLSWLANEYSSEGPKDPYSFSTNFSNSTFDAWRNQLLYSLSYEDTFEAASEMQKILHYNVPRLVVYQNIYSQPYRNDRFERYILDSANSISGPWTMLSVKPIGDTYGGTISVAVYNELYFNFLVTESYSGHWFFTNMHYALYTSAPDLEPYPQLTETMNVDTHSDDPSVPEGNTRFTFDIRDDIEWTDGVPVTADDVIFTINYALETKEFGNPIGNDLTDLAALYAPTPHSFVIEFSTESYWNFNKFAYTFILPKHIFDGSNPEDWNEWELVTNEDGNSLNCGPFMLTDFEESEMYELTSRNPWPETGNDYLGVYVADIASKDDVQVIFPYFTLSWVIEWNTIWFDNHAVDEGEFCMAFTPGYASFSYTVLLDGEVYTVGSWTGSYPPINSIDVSFGDSMLDPGQHNVTLILETGYRQVQIDTVMVTVILPSSGLTFILGLPLPCIAYIVFLYVERFRERRRPMIVVE